jgi:hypothetical protein
MLHTSDIYEVRARAARHQELRHLAHALYGLLFRHGTARAIPDSRPVERIKFANDRGLYASSQTTNRAA